MQAREKKLAVLAGGLLAIVGGAAVYGRVQNLYEQREQRISALRSTLDQRDMAIRQGEQASRKLQRWREQSLPSSVQIARSLYQNWLLDEVNAARLQDVDISTQVLQGGRGVFDKLGFTINCRGSLSALVQFLHAFYRADHLHQIRRLSVQPAAQTLELSLGIEALVLHDADRTEELSSAQSNRLTHGDVATYASQISDRNLFAPYRAPETPVAGPPPFDAIRYTFVTGVTHDPAGGEVWIHVRHTGEQLRLAVGEQFAVGDFQATVVDIGSREVIFDVNGQLLVVAVGQHFRQASSIEP